MQFMPYRLLNQNRVFQPEIFAVEQQEPTCFELDHMRGQAGNNESVGLYLVE